MQPVRMPMNAKIMEESASTKSAGNKPNTSKGSSTTKPPAPAPPPPMNMNTPKCELDNRNVISLSDILNSFHAPISEEYAWALTYQCAKCGQAVLGSDEERESCHLVTEANQLLIHKDGQIHPHTFTSPSAEATLMSTATSSSGKAGNASAVQGKGPPRIKSTEECKVISQLALVIYQALDYGMSSDEERPLSADLESLLEAMSSADESAERSETDDEGIERDSGDSDDTDDRSPGQRSFTFNTIIELCSRRLGSSILSNYGSQSDAATDSHYKAVCRALVAEALELSSFLQQVSAGTHQLRQSSNGSRNAPPLPDPDLDKLQFTDWARLWVQVIRELRHGVKLKKVDFSPGPPIEYELTPYEILMDDIRSRRYKLNKVMVDGNLPPRIKKDAHAIILEFIRSRPPLKKVTERILGPAPKANTNPIELLMQSIREEHNLRPAHRRRDSARNRARRIQTASEMIDTSTSASHSHSQNSHSHSHGHASHRRHSSSSSTASHTSTTGPAPPQQHQQQPQGNQQPQRRLIKADFDFLYSLNTKDDDDEDGFDDSPSGSFFGHIYPEATQSTPASPWKKPLEPQFEKSRVEDLDLRRRHTICNPTSRDEYGSTMVSFPFEYTNSLNVFNNLNCTRASPILQRRMAKLPHSMSKSSLQEEFFQSNHWQTAMECLSLNLEEVVHIRNVLTKAELEGLPMDCSLKEDVEKGKVCFLCLKTRFSLLFGPWGNTCKLCKRTICAKCCSRMRIPMEHFAKVPVSTLSPNLSPREEERSLPGSSMNLGPNSASAENSLAPNRESFSSGHSGGRKNSVGSAPNSPNTSRKSDTGVDSGSEQRSKSPSHTDADEERDRFSPEHTGYGPRSLPTVASISSGLMAWQRRRFGPGKDDKTEKLKGALMIVCHDCKAMVLEIIRSSRSKKPLGPNNKNLPFLTN